MSATSVQIVNLALRSLGVKRITALDDNIESARVMTDLYVHIRDEMVSLHPWNFAIAYSSALAENDDAPNFDYDYSYALPADCLRVIELEEDEEGERFKVVGGNLYTDVSSPKIKYIQQITDTSKFPPYFVTALAARLAAEACYPLTTSKTLAEQKAEEYKIKLQKAKSADAQEGTAEKEESCSWIDERA